VGRYDVVLRSLWYYIPELLMDLIEYLPTARWRRFRTYRAFMRNFSREIIEKSMIDGDGKDIMSVLLRANASEDPRGRLSDVEMVDQIK
jgi:cytochrome P450